MVNKPVDEEKIQALEALPISCTYEIILNYPKWKNLNFEWNFKFSMIAKSYIKLIIHIILITIFSVSSKVLISI